MKLPRICSVSNTLNGINYLFILETIEELLEDYPDFINLLDECIIANENLLIDIAEIILILIGVGGLGVMWIIIISLSKRLQFEILLYLL